MGDFEWTNIIWAGIMVFFILRLWPNAKEWMKNGPKGDSNDWTTFIIIIAAIALFVALMISSVQKG